MRKIIVDSIQSSSGTPLDIFESNSTGGVVFKDSTDGVFKDASFPADIKKIRGPVEGTSAQFIEIPLQDAQGNVKDGVALHLAYNYENTIGHPGYASGNHSFARALKVYVKDSGGSTITSDETYFKSCGFRQNWYDEEFTDAATRDYLPIDSGNQQISNQADRVSYRDVVINLIQDSGKWHFLMNYKGADTNSQPNFNISVVNAGGHMQFPSGTPHTLVIETGATVGNDENAMTVWDMKGYADE